MAKVLSFESVINLIKEGGYGTYRLYLIPGSELLGGSHLTEENKDSKWTPDDVISHLQGKMEYLGTGNYCLKLKKSNSTPNTAEVTYRFNYVEEGTAPASAAAQPVFNGYQGLSGDKLEEVISKRVEKALADEREKNVLRDQMKELLFEMKQLKSRKRPASKEGSVLKGLMDLGKIAAVTIIAEKYPKSVPLVEKTLSTMAAAIDEEEEDEEEETGFTTPE